MGFDYVLGLQPRDIGPDLGILPMLLEKVLDPGPRKAEQRFMDELDGRCGTLDVQEDRTDVGQRDAVRRGKYVGPMQSGW